ncbi:MmpS family transport accessory protein [Mycolicibacterium arenosum]|uniref:MmpS family transport accessory protein n=1 Tax=Mycolicibacterium arenosum TaxID=2952157 RepID=UPI0026E50814|nr:MmpS family transport accessory protein [Mycolicibacterium sp. CAU 1645]
MSGFSISRTLKSNWMILVAVVVVAIAGFAVYRLNGIFGSEDVVSTPDNSANDTKPFNPKRVLLEVWGPPGATASISYLDINAQPQHAVDAALPWTYDVTTTQPTVFVNVQAQGDGDSLSCRITIDDAVKDERTVNQLNAYTFCLDKSG